MPIYEYQCPECANIFEEWAKAAEMQEQAPCPLCQTLSERIISHTAFVLKGGGWYVTDYGYRKNISEDSTAAASAGSAAQVPAAAATPTSAPTSATDTAASSKGESPAPKTDSPAASTTSPAAAPAPSSGANTAA